MQTEISEKTDLYQNIPEHIGIIPDGNRRYAKKHGKPTAHGHFKGYKTLSDLVEYFPEYGVNELTIYGFSTENMKRSEDEKSKIFSIIEIGLDEIMKKTEDKKYKITFPGRKEILPPELAEHMEEIEDSTSKNSYPRLNICLAYGGRAELVDAIKNIADKTKNGEIAPEQLTEKVISEYLDVENDVDLVIRTGERRLSNFLNWQTSYSELIFLEDILWPEFDRNTFESCLKEYTERKRNFGK